MSIMMDLYAGCAHPPTCVYSGYFFYYGMKWTFGDKKVS